MKDFAEIGLNYPDLIGGFGAMELVQDPWQYGDGAAVHGGPDRKGARPHPAWHPQAQIESITRQLLDSQITAANRRYNRRRRGTLAHRADRKKGNPRTPLIRRIANQRWTTFTHRQTAAAADRPRRARIEFRFQARAHGARRSKPDRSRATATRFRGNDGPAQAQNAD